MAGRKVWAADEVLSADDLQEYIQDQVVFVYESSGARASGILAPTEGMVSYLKDTNQVSVYNGTAWVDIAPDVGTPGTYTKVTTDFKGRVSSGTTLAAGDIPALDASKITSGTLSDARLANVGSAGTYTKVTTDAKGRVSSGTTLAAADIPSLDASKTTSGAFAEARIPNLPTSKITGYGTGTWSGTVSTTGSIGTTSTLFSAAGISTNGSLTVDGNITGINTYVQTNTGRAMFVNSGGLYGIGASSRRFKENIVDAEIDTDAVLDIQVRKFNYKKSFDETMPEDIGVIAEELEELGLTDFIYFDAEGVPDGVAYEKLALALIPVLKKQQAQIDSVVARLDELEK
jgi:hypothetical protein